MQRADITSTARTAVICIIFFRPDGKVMFARTDYNNET